MYFNRLKPSITFYKIIALLCFIILGYVQAKLIYNTYELKNRQYELEEKDIINQSYSQSIRNDKVFPGGQKLIDSFIYRNIYRLEQLYRNSFNAFELNKQVICDSIFRELQLKSNMDSLFREIVSTHHLKENLKYSVFIENLSITFNGVIYIPLYNIQHPPYLFISPDMQTKNGIHIDGDLKNINSQNRITYLTVSIPNQYSYQISFALYADEDNRFYTIIEAMLPTLSLSLFSIICVTTIYYFTYRNWLRQKKLADMKSDFLNSITHEFNTPLSTILVANKSLQKPEIIANKENIINLTAVISRQTRRLHTLVSQALEISSINKASLEKESVELNTFLMELINDYKLKATDNVNIIYKARTYGIAPLNRFLFTTMLYNIFDNSIKYNTALKKELFVNMHIEEHFIVISIEDNGIGMSRELTTHIFDKFYRGNNELMASGLGLGLFYVKQTLDAHGWTLKLTSEIGIGSKFRIFIPVPLNQN